MSRPRFWDSLDPKQPRQDMHIELAIQLYLQHRIFNHPV
jgi:hypothetical protein